eukprot:scaffold36319_cov53-Phaeocystis_antarctica.AAC.2
MLRVLDPRAGDQARLVRVRIRVGVGVRLRDATGLPVAQAFSTLAFEHLGREHGELAPGRLLVAVGLAWLGVGLGLGLGLGLG